MDSNGDLAAALYVRLRGAVGCIAADVDPEGQVGLTLRLLAGGVKCAAGRQGFAPASRTGQMPAAATASAPAAHSTSAGLVEQADRMARRAAMRAA